MSAATNRRRPLTLADLTEREHTALRLCVHEAAHSVVGVVMGGRLSTAVVGGGRVTGVQGATLFADMSTGRHPVVALAGPYGEARWAADCRRPTVWEVDAVLAGGGRKDHAAIIAAGSSVPEVSGELAGLVERCWPSVVTVAQQLYRTGEVFHADVCAALGIPATGNSLHLSLIRSGAAPGSFTVTPAATGD
ncbi:MAG: hypothetical protein K0U84_03450 [Actinomycetia bacterium]|nr:hypothetical protein [Actinomycetes bacterium]